MSYFAHISWLGVLTFSIKNILIPFQIVFFVWQCRWVGFQHLHCLVTHPSYAQCMLNQKRNNSWHSSLLWMTAIDWSAIRWHTISIYFTHIKRVYNLNYYQSAGVSLSHNFVWICSMQFIVPELELLLVRLYSVAHDDCDNSALSHFFVLPQRVRRRTSFLHWNAVE